MSTCMVDTCEDKTYYHSIYCKNHSCCICYSYKNVDDNYCIRHHCEVVGCKDNRGYEGRFCYDHACNKCHNQKVDLSIHCEACLSDDPDNFYKKCSVEGCKNVPVARTQVCSIHKCCNGDCDVTKSPDVKYCLYCKCLKCDKVRKLGRAVCNNHQIC